MKRFKNRTVSLSSYETLFSDITGNIVLIKDKKEERILWVTLKDRLKQAPKNKDILAMFYGVGLWEDETHSVAYIADFYGVTGGRVRTIVNDCIRGFRTVIAFAQDDLDLALLPLLNKRYLYDRLVKLEKGKEFRVGVGEKDLYFFDFSTRTYNILRRNGYNCLNDLTLISLSDLRRLSGLGVTSYNEVVRIMRRNGLLFKGEENDK